MCILLVDDENIIRMLVGAILEEAGCAFMSASTGAEAIEILATHPPGHFTCLMTDFNMSNGVTGADLIEHARRSYPSIPMILATAMPESTTPEWRQTNSVELLIKPFRERDILNIINTITPSG